MRCPTRLWIPAPWSLAFRCSADGDLRHRLPRGTTPELDGDRHQPPSFSKRGGTLRRIAPHCTREFAIVPGVDDLESRPDVGCVATLVCDRATDPLRSSAGSRLCAVSHSESLRHVQHSRGARGANARLRIPIGLTRRCGQVASRAARGRRKHHELCEASDPSIRHQLQMPSGADVRRDSSPATQASSSAEWVIRHRCLSFQLGKPKGRPEHGLPMLETLASYKY
jgi:hypothetical protein